MLHTSEKTHHVVGLLNKWNNAIVDDFNKYVKEVNIFRTVTKEEITRHIAQGKGRGLHIWGEGHGVEHIQHFPSISKLIEEVDGDPNILTTAVFAAISDGKCRVNLHTDVDTEFIIHERPGKLFKRKIRQYRAHIAIEIPPEGCYFYYVDDKIKKIHWEIGKCFIFDKYNRHFTKNDSDLTRVILEYDFFQAV